MCGRFFNSENFSFDNSIELPEANFFFAMMKTLRYLTKMRTTNAACSKFLHHSRNHQQKNETNQNKTQKAKTQKAQFLKEVWAVSMENSGKSFETS